MLRKLSRILLVIMLFVIAATMSLNWFMIVLSSDQYSADLKQVPEAQAAMVLGASVIAGKKPSGILLERLDRAVELYRHKKVQKLLLSGDNTKKYYDEVNVMKDYVLRRNVAAADIFLDHNGLRTLDSIYRAKHVFKARKLIIVTQDFHLPRALFLANHIGLKSYGYAANSGRVDISLKMKLREFSARVLAFLDAYVLESKPRYLGKTTPLSKNGRITWNKQR